MTTVLATWFQPDFLGLRPYDSDPRLTLHAAEALTGTVLLGKRLVCVRATPDYVAPPPPPPESGLPPPPPEMTWNIPGAAIALLEPATAVRRCRLTSGLTLG